jgi:hypothetical protein
MDTESYIIRQCKKCKHRQRLDYPKRELAFGFHESAPFNCEKCNFGESDYSEIHGINLDDDILLEWSTNKDLYLMEQDEELFLANEDYLELVLKFLDKSTTLITKKNILMEALCVLTYDLLINKSNEQLLRKLKTELLKRKKIFLNSEVSDIEYLSKKIFPFLELKNKNS